jgi:hypothetical protein
MTNNALARPRAMDIVHYIIRAMETSTSIGHCTNTSVNC